MINILIVDDLQSMRDAIRNAFSESKEFSVIGELSGANLAQLYVQKYKPDLVFMDVCTEGNASGLAATEKIKSEYPDVKVIIMTAFDEVSYLPRAREIGADGFIYKSRSLYSFVDVAKKVMQGESSFPEPKKLPLPKGELPLTDREMEVLRLVCKHMTNKEIAQELFISESTVKYHKSNMLGKTGFKKSVDLAFYMITNGYINPLY